MFPSRRRTRRIFGAPPWKESGPRQCNKTVAYLAETVILWSPRSWSCPSAWQSPSARVQSRRPFRRPVRRPVVDMQRLVSRTSLQNSLDGLFVSVAGEVTVPAVESGSRHEGGSIEPQDDRTIGEETGARKRG